MVRKVGTEADTESIELLDLQDGRDPAVPTTVVGSDRRIELLRSPLVVLAAGVVLAAAVLLLRDQPQPMAETESEAVQAPPVSLAESRVSLIPPTTLPEGELLVEVETDFWLFYGGENPLQRLDLDNGEFVTFGIRANPVLATGSSLVISTALPEDLSTWVSLDNPGEQPQIWKRGLIAQAAHEGDVWIYEEESPTDPGPTWNRFDTEGQQHLERLPAFVPAEDGGGYGRARVLVPGPELVSDGQSIFEYSNDEYERRGPGSVLYYDNGHALTVQCPEQTCYTQWVARATWEPFAFPTPYDPPVDVEFLAGASWLYSVSEGEIENERIREVPGAAFKDADRPPVTARRDQRQDDASAGGRTIELLPTFVFGSFYFDEDTAVNMSSDGRWLAWETQSASIELLDLRTQKSYDLSQFDVSGEGSLLFVEKRRLTN